MKLGSSLGELCHIRYPLYELLDIPYSRLCSIILHQNWHPVVTISIQRSIFHCNSLLSTTCPHLVGSKLKVSYRNNSNVNSMKWVVSCGEVVNQRTFRAKIQVQIPHKACCCIDVANQVNYY